MFVLAHFYWCIRQLTSSGNIILTTAPRQLVSNDDIENILCAPIIFKLELNSLIRCIVVIAHYSEGYDTLIILISGGELNKICVFRHRGCEKVFACLPNVKWIP